MCHALTHSLTPYSLTPHSINLHSLTQSRRHSRPVPCMGHDYIHALDKETKPKKKIKDKKWQINKGKLPFEVTRDLTARHNATKGEPCHSRPRNDMQHVSNWSYVVLLNVPAYVFLSFLLLTFYADWITSCAMHNYPTTRNIYSISGIEQKGVKSLAGCLCRVSPPLLSHWNSVPSVRCTASSTPP